MEANNQQAEDRCDQDAPDEHVGAFVEISCTESLRRESAGTHAHEAAVPVDEVEDGYADGECPDRRCGVVQVSCDGGTHDTHKGTVMLEMMFGTANRRISRFMSWVLMRKYTAFTGKGKYFGTVFRSDFRRDNPLSRK